MVLGYDKEEMGLDRQKKANLQRELRKRKTFGLNSALVGIMHSQALGEFWGLSKMAVVEGLKCS